MTYHQLLLVWGGFNDGVGGLPTTGGLPTRSFFRGFFFFVGRVSMETKQKNKKKKKKYTRTPVNLLSGSGVEKR